MLRKCVRVIIFVSSTLIFIHILSIAGFGLFISSSAKWLERVKEKRRTWFADKEARIKFMYSALRIYWRCSLLVFFLIHRRDHAANSVRLFTHNLLRKLLRFQFLLLNQMGNSESNVTDTLFKKKRLWCPLSSENKKRNINVENWFHFLSILSRLIKVKKIGCEKFCK